VVEISESANEVVDRIVLTPDPALVKSLGTHHTLESAMADLVDNSIDAGATTVTIRLVAPGGVLVGISVIDNGRGMDGDTASHAMRLGGQREYSSTDLGHFGVGLKAAALGSAGVLTVWSKRYGATAVGRRIRKLDLARDYTCEILSADAAERALAYSLPDEEHGTVVALSDLQVGVHGASSKESRKWLTKKANSIVEHLGLVFHRLIAAGGITVSVLEVGDDGSVGSALPVKPVDPFAYPRAAARGYPKKMGTVVDGADVSFECHVWPPRQDNLSTFRLGSSSPDNLQGFFVYRANRLLQVGGWNGVVGELPARRLARVAIDVDDLGDLVQLNPEKSGVKFSPTLAAAINSAASGGAGAVVTFKEFITAAEEAYVGSKKRQHRTVNIVEPGQGFSPAVRNTMRAETHILDGEQPVGVKWKRLPAGDFFEIDRESRVLWLSSKYREALSNGTRGSNDAPVLKTLIYLLAQDHFTGIQYSSVKRGEAETWQRLLVAAAEDELFRYAPKETHE